MKLQKPPKSALECEWYRAGACKIGGMCTMDIGNECKCAKEEE